MTNQIYPCLWFDGQAKAAAEFYCSVFPNSMVVSETPMVTMWEIYGQKFMGLNGGPTFTPNPSVSFFVTCETNEEVDIIWQRINEGGKIMMPLDKYDWSEYYGFVQDKFGVSWQIFKGKYSDVNQKIVPCFLFTDHNFGKAKAAVEFYTKVIQNSKTEGILLYDENEMKEKNIVKHSQFLLNGNVFMAMDGAGQHNFEFTEGTSFVINCDTQDQIDYYWDVFTKDGGQESMCGWCKDKFGVSWQIVPSILGKLMNDPEKMQNVVAAFMKMKKFDIQTLLSA
ncbi:MAG: VOC family protein [Saprospiraceae bacterium]|nr:VOC family protein [Saprospiraceae bacterium]